MLCSSLTAIVFQSLLSVIVTTRPTLAGQDELSAAELRYLALETEVALANDAQIGHLPFKLSVENNSIVLSGEVPDNGTRAAAERVARRILRGYDVKVVNKIRVIVAEAQPAPPGKPTPFDEKQMEKLRQMLDDEYGDLAADITVSFDTQPMPTLVLEGLIPSYEQKLEISRFIRRSFKDLPVVNNVRVRRNFEGDKSFYVESPERSEGSVRVIEPRRHSLRNEPETTVVIKRQNDAEIAKQLGATLRADPVIQKCNIEVRVDDGVAWLAGRVEGPGQKVRAIKLASVHPGVRYVVNQLEIRPTSDEEPNKITVRASAPDDVVVYLQRYFSTRLLELQDAEVEVDDDSIVIVAPSGTEMTEAELRALELRLAKLHELKGYKVVIRTPDEKAKR